MVRDELFGLLILVMKLISFGVRFCEKEVLVGLGSFSCGNVFFVYWNIVVLGLVDW